MSVMTGSRASEPDTDALSAAAQPVTWSDRLRSLVTDPTALLLGATALGATLVFWLMHRAFIDDAYITLSHARTLADHGQWGLLPGYQANTATSPLHVLLLGGVAVLAGDPVRALGFVYVANAVALALGLRGLGRALGLGLRPALIGLPLLVLNPLLASTIGLETTLVVTAIVFLAWSMVTGHPTAFGVVAGLMLLLRLDLVLVVGAVFAFSPVLWRENKRVAAVGASLLLPWLVFSWIVLGSAVPDTLLIKQESLRGGFVTGLFVRFWDPFPWAVTGSVAMAGLGAVAAVAWPLWQKRWLESVPPVVPALGVAGLAYFLGVWALSVPPFFWYYGPTIACLTLCAVLALSALSLQAGSERARRVVLALGAAMAVPALVPWGITAAHQTPFEAAPLHGNWATPGEYATIGRQLPALTDGAAVKGPGEVGTLAYFCECTIADRFSDRGQLRGLIREKIEENWLYRLNYSWLDLEELDPIAPPYQLSWEDGPDTGRRSWPATTPADYPRPSGNIVLRYVGPQSAARPSTGGT